VVDAVVVMSLKLVATVMTELQTNAGVKPLLRMLQRMRTHQIQDIATFTPMGRT
jgi:hypothetical protein